MKNNVRMYITSRDSDEKSRASLETSNIFDRIIIEMRNSAKKSSEYFVNRLTLFIHIIYHLKADSFI